MTDVELRARCAVDDAELSALHARAFGGPLRRQPWADRLARHSLTWVGAFLLPPQGGDADRGRMVGFVNVAWDGGIHAFLLDVVVEPDRQGGGVGAALVAEAVRLAAEAGCAWMHVDHVPELAPFYLDRCGFTPTAAGLVALHPA
jgi:ribosomal protein S18 acetylase RimI-like enzyme